MYLFNLISVTEILFKMEIIVMSDFYSAKGRPSESNRALSEMSLPHQGHQVS